MLSGEILSITETLSAVLGPLKTAGRYSSLISDSALKVVFLTTLYVDVKEPAVHYISPQKKLNLVPTKLQRTRRDRFPFLLPGQN
jgi:hypothetical protein